MIVLHPNSACDVCLEGYGASNAPYAITCGHIFCLRCLRSLTKQSCPLCRTGFHSLDIRKLHVDDSSRSTSPSDSTSQPSSPHGDGSLETARDFQTRITRIVTDGASSSAKVRDILDEVRDWLAEQDPEKHSDLRAAWVMLFKYTNVTFKFKDSKDTIVGLQQDIEELKEKMRDERESAEARYHELSQKRVSEMETAMAVERSLRDHFDQMDKEWRGKYEACLGDYRRLHDELRRLKHKPLAGMSRPTEARHPPLSDRSPEAMAVVEDEEAEETPASPEQEPFVLSPIPPLASLPISSNPNRQVFRPLTAEESDVEDLKSRRTNPYLLRSIDAISVRPSVHRMNSNSSLLSRGDDQSMSRSIPRSSADVHMASCSSSPNKTQFMGRERDDPMMTGEVPRSRRSSGDRMKAFNNMKDQPDDEEAQQERWRAQLHHILETPQMSKLSASMLRSPESRPTLRQRCPESSAPVSRTTSPTSSTSSSSSAQPTQSSQPFQNSTLLRPPLSRASTAAMQAERDRARTTSLKDASAPSTTGSMSRERNPMNYSQMPPAPPMPTNHYYPRRPSVGTQARPAAQSQQPGHVLRNMWAMEPQRAS
ncbi:hypothetical protein BDW22DRAFT_1207096 [Trametopsis cervina]|nr:hypothetical protein BDW22DRAFT_1207096 [Trametopsis cervina]